MEFFLPFTHALDLRISQIFLANFKTADLYDAARCNTPIQGCPKKEVRRNLFPSPLDSLPGFQ